MKMNTFAAKVSVAALCAAACTLATPAHAQWALQGYQVAPNGFVDNSNGDQGNANHGADHAAGFLAATAGGQGTTYSGSQSSGQYSLTDMQTYVWQGGGTPAGFFFSDETTTLSTVATAVPGNVATSSGAQSGAGTSNAKYHATSSVTAGLGTSAPPRNRPTATGLRLYMCSLPLRPGTRRGTF